MKAAAARLLVCLLPAYLVVATAQAADPYMAVNNANGDYLTLHYYIDESQGDTETAKVDFYPNVDNVESAQVWTDLNRRDKATLGDQDATSIPGPSETSTNYWVGMPMSKSGNGWTLSIPVNKTGAYRITCRYKLAGGSTWQWYQGRNTAVVVSPKKARDVILYELLVNTVNASGDDFNSRSTFNDLVSKPGYCDLDYLKWLGVNTIWMQPIHPIGSDSCDSQQPGSPYRIKNMWSVAPYLAPGGSPSRDDAMSAFTNFSRHAKSKGIDVFFDIIFNHTAWDAEIGRDPDNPAGGWYSPSTAEIRNVRPKWYSKYTGSFKCDRNGYNQGDFQYTVFADSAGQLGPAPAERIDFGKWTDVPDLFWGVYPALSNPQTDQDSYWNTEMNGVVPGANVRKMVEYFAYFAQYWLQQSQNTLSGFRCDYAQGLPPQAWEYLINRTRSTKWDFIFMAESLDGGNVSKRAGRHVDIINQNWVWQVGDGGSGGGTSVGGMRGVIDTVKSDYGYAGIMRGLINHDQNAPGNKWYTFSRYAIGACIDGTPQMYQGQELGYVNNWGFSKFRNEYNRYIPNILVWHNMKALWDNTDQQLKWQYHRLNTGRMRNIATRLYEQWYLDGTDGNINNNIFSVMKYSNKGYDPGDQNVVCCFVNMNPGTATAGSFNINVAALSLDNNTDYNIKNLTSDNPDTFVWGTPKKGSELKSSGLYVSFPADLNQDSAAVQFLKLERAGPVSSNKLSWVGNVETFPGPTKPENLTLEPWEDLWINCETFAIGPGQTLTVAYSNSVDGFWQSKTMDWRDNDGNGGVNSRWELNLGTFPANTKIRFAVNAVDGGTNLWANNNGNDYTISVVNAQQPCNPDNNVQYVGRGHYAPVPLPANSNLHVETTSYPVKPNQKAEIIFCLGGNCDTGSWPKAEMSWFKNDWVSSTNESHVVYSNLHSFWQYSFASALLSPGMTVKWAYVVSNPGCTNSSWDSNAGSNYVLVVQTAGDSNQNGIPDDWELANFNSLTNPAHGDHDGDGVPNDDEYWSNTEPTNRNSYLRIAALTLGTNGHTGEITIQWTGSKRNGVPLTYEIRASYNGVAGPYNKLTERSLPPEAPPSYPIIFTDTNAIQFNNGYYRIVVPYGQ